MPSKNTTVFAVLCALLLTAMLFGVYRNGPADDKNTAMQKTTANDDATIPAIGKIQVLNGYGGVGAADDVTDFLRKCGFDVKNKGNAASFNYPFTIVISRTKNMTIAHKIADSLKTDHIALVRNEDTTYNVTVIIGRDYKERIR
jgi:hypothetical protein